MREDLENLVGKVEIFEAEVRRRKGPAMFGGKPYQQRILQNITNNEHNVYIDHMVMVIGKDIPNIPIVYSRVCPDSKIKFEARVNKYRRRDGSIDFGLKILRILESNIGRI